MIRIDVFPGVSSLILYRQMIETLRQNSQRLYEEAQLLKNHPEAGYRYETESSRTVRILLYSHYRITYLIKPDGNIDILGVFHGSLEIDRDLV